MEYTKAWLILNLEFLLDLKSNQDDVTATFHHVDISEDENINVEIPRGYEQFLKNRRKIFWSWKDDLWYLSDSTCFISVHEEKF